MGIVAQLDAKMQELLEDEARLVTGLRGRIAGILEGLAAAIPKAKALYAQGPQGQAASIQFQTDWAAWELESVNRDMRLMGAMAESNASLVNRWTGDYLEVSSMATVATPSASAMTPSTLEPRYLLGLAGAQAGASLELGKAAEATDGADKEVAITHGETCAATATAVTAAVAARKAAIKSLQAVCMDRAKQLHFTAAKYEGTSADAADELYGVL
ncbi:hypothetical protein A5641_10315 [Mycobacterium sp. 1554424.7]|nr:hypothetical protein A5641_10310 [Mycobacterium sp. 1554424.7]OBA71701.1 hypothetical protein A5641_10315 [Mycobacterium sp. 1554424.7]